MTGPFAYIWRKPDGSEVMIAPDQIWVVRDPETPNYGLSQVEALASIAAAGRELAAAVNTLAEVISRTDEISAQPSGQPGPAKGLHTHVRPNPEHRDRNARGSFGTIRAVGFTTDPRWQEDRQ